MMTSPVHVRSVTDTDPTPPNSTVDPRLRDDTPSAPATQSLSPDPGHDREPRRSRWFGTAHPVMPDPDALARRIRDARTTIAVLDGNTALRDAPTEADIDAEVALAAWTRAHHRRERRRHVRADLAAHARDRRTAAAINRVDNRLRRWTDRAHAAQLRATDPHARIATTHRNAVWSSWALRAVALIGLFWSAVNVAGNLAGDTTHTGSVWRLQWALGFGVEAMISIPIIVLMVQATTAARLGHTDNTRVVAFEAILLLATVGLNAGPHLAHHHLGQAAESGVVPVMVTVVIWLHARVAATYGRLIAGIPLPRNDPEDADTHPIPHTAGDMDSMVERHSCPSAAPRTPSTSPMVHQTDTDLYRFADDMVRRGLTQKSVDDIVTILRLAADRTPNAIAEDMTRITGAKWSRSTVDRLLNRAQLLRARHQPERASTTRTA